MHFGDERGQMRSDSPGTLEVRRAVRRLRHSGVGWRGGVPAGLPEASG